MFYYDMRLAFAGVCVVVVATLIDFALLRRQLKYQKIIVDSSADLYNTTLQSLSSIAQVRTNANELYVLDHWFEKILKISDLSYESARLSDFNSAISSFASIFGNAVIYSVLITKILSQSSAQGAIATVGSFIIFSSAYSSFSSNFAEFVGFINTLFGSLLIDFNRGAPMIRQLEEQSFQSGSRRVDLLSDIKIDGLSFSYPNSKKLVPKYNCPALFVYGDKESNEFIRQSEDQASFWTHSNSHAKCAKIKNSNHATIVEQLGNSKSEMYKLFQTVIKSKDE